MKSFPLLVLLVVTAAWTLSTGTGCGSSADTTRATPGDASGDVESTDGAEDSPGMITPDPNYPTAHAPLPTVDFHGGTIITTPKIVSVTFDSNTQRAMLDQFGDTITTTKWWDAVRAGYCDSSGNCVGQGVSGGHGHLADIPMTSFTDSTDPTGASTLRDFLMTQANAGALPAPDPNTIYVIYLPSNSTISLDGSQLCVSLSAYHNFGYIPETDGGTDGGEGGTTSGNPAPGTAPTYAYAVIPDCGGTIVTPTNAASHEIIEAATDPVFTGFYMIEPSWDYDGVENGDLCVSHSPNDKWEDAGAELYQEGTYTVQRIWSNVSAQASHDPCVPAPPIPYFNVAPTAGQESFSLKVGGSKTVTMTAYSDAPTPDFQLTAKELNVIRGEPGVLSFGLNQSIVNNGSKISLTVTLKSKPAASPIRFFVVSSVGGVQHAWAMSVTTQ